MTKNGQRFYNSSPQLFQPLSDYACAGQPFYTYFTGVDPDGDSLVYSMITPLNGFTSHDIPRMHGPKPGPYPSVQFLPGIDAQNQVPGSPSLSISIDGLLTVTPSASGLYVFGVRCEEFRAGKKIGEVRRDFQILVIECPENAYPKIEGIDGGSIALGDTLMYEPGKCLAMSVSDPSAQSSISHRIVNKRFTNPVRISPALQDIVAPEVAVFEICLPDCPLPNGMPYIFEVIAMDNSCALPLTDTVILSSLECRSQLLKGILYWKVIFLGLPLANCQTVFSSMGSYCCLLILLL